MIVSNEDPAASQQLPEPEPPSGPKISSRLRALALALVCALPLEASRAETAPGGESDGSFAALTLPDVPDGLEGQVEVQPEQNQGSNHGDLVEAAPEKSDSKWWDRLWSAAGVLIGALGYVSYYTRSVPEDERSKHLISRLGEHLFPNEDYFRGNKTALRIFSMNHVSMLLAGTAASLEAGQSLIPMVVPALFLAGSLTCYTAARRYGGEGKVSGWVRGSEALAYGSLAVFLASKFHFDGGIFEALGTSGTTVGVFAALAARAVGVIPMSLDFINAARDPVGHPSFPPLRNQVYWWMAAACGAATVSLPLTAAAAVPLGYVGVGSCLLGLGLACKAIWRRAAG